MRPAHLIVLLVLNFFWAATLSVYKVIEGYLSPGNIVTLRFGLAGLALAPLWPWLRGAAPRGRDLARTVLMGLIVFVAGQRLQVLGNKLSTASNSSVLVAFEPLLTSVAAALFLREHIGPRRWTGFALGMVGVVLVNGPWREGFQWVSLGASVIFVLSFLGDASYSILGKPILARAHPVKVLAVALAVGTAVNLMLDGGSTLAAARHLPGQVWLLLLVLALVCTAFGYAFWYRVIAEGEVNVAALTIFAQPVFGVLLAKFWVGEALHAGQLWGSVAIVLGLAVGLSRQIKREGKGAEALKL